MLSTNKSQFSPSQKFPSEDRSFLAQIYSAWKRVGGNSYPMTDGFKATKVQPLCLTQEYSKWPPPFHIGIGESSLITTTQFQLLPWSSPALFIPSRGLFLRALPSKTSAYKSVSELGFLGNLIYNQNLVCWKFKVQQTEVHAWRYITMIIPWKVSQYS